MSTQKVCLTKIKDPKINIHGITNDLQTFINISIDDLAEKDINKILNLHLPINHVDNLIKITNHTNENLKLLKSSLINNRNLIVEEISCLNEVFEDTVSSNMNISSETPVEEQICTKNIENLDINIEQINSDDEGELREEDEDTADSDSETYKLLNDIKKTKDIKLGTPRSVDFTKLP